MANGDGNSGSSDLTVPADKLRQLEEVVTERNKIQALIVKAEESRGRVKQEIFDKVLSDYEAKLASAASRYEPVREEIADYLSGIHAAEEGIRKELSAINDEIEELKFR